MSVVLLHVRKRAVTLWGKARAFARANGLSVSELVFWALSDFFGEPWESAAERTLRAAKKRASGKEGKK